MKKRLVALLKQLLANSLFSMFQYVATFISVMVLLFLSATVVFFQWNQINRTYVPPSASVSSGANSSTQDGQVLAEAQQDVSVANDVITWSGFFLAFIASSVAIAGFFGLHEFRRIQHLRSEIDKDSQAVSMLKEQVREALDQLGTVVRRESQTFMEIAYNLGAADDAYKLGNNRSAIKHYLRVLKLQPENKRVMERLGRAYNNLNQVPASIDYLQQALKIDPSYEPALRSLGLCYRYTDKDKAIEKLKLALANDPRDYEALDFLGLIYRDNGLISEAIAAHEQALTIKKRPETQFYLSLLYARTGNKKDATRMALNAEADLNVKDPDEEMRPVWQIIIRAGVPILDGDEQKAYDIIETITDYVTNQRTCDALKGHLKFLLEATGHSAWIDKFTSVLKVIK